MKKIKIFLAPNVEIRIHVTEEMERDMRACRKSIADEKYEEITCENCSWGDAKIDCTSMCELDGVIRQVLGGAE